MHFKGDAVKEFLKVLINLAKEGVEVLSGIFDSSLVGKGNVDTGFVFTIGKDVSGKGL